MSKNAYRALIVVAVAGCVIAGFHFKIFDSWQEQLTDRFFLRSTEPKHLVIVAADEASLALFGQWPWPRARFAEAIDKLQRAKAIGIDINFSEPSRAGAGDDARLAAALKASVVPVVLPVEMDAVGRITTRPLPAFEDVTQQGFVNVHFGPDGILRGVATHAVTPTGQKLSSFSAVLAGEVAVGAPDQFRIAYRGPSQTVLTVSLADVVQGSIPDSVFEGAYVLVGATAESLRDYFKTPFGLMAGVEVHANALDTVVGRRFIHELSALFVGLLLFLLVAKTALLVAYVRNFAALTGSLIALVAALLVFCLWLFSYGVLVPLLYLLVAVALAAAATLAFEYVSESKEKQFIRKSFQHYLSPVVVEELMENPEKLALGGEKKMLTILFSDIRSFTTISEGMSPEDLTHFMNEYLTAMTEIILAHGGLVDKYIGDAIMAFWGAPIDDHEQARHASEAAVAMQDALGELNRQWRKRGIPHISIGIGLNTGEVVVGNMGSTERFNYTIMGDEVNFASRLEGLTKKYAVDCLIGERTQNKISGVDALVTRELDLVRVKGKREPKKIFELSTKPFSPAFLAEFAQGREAYMRGAWDAAIKHFKKALAEGQDATTNLFIERCEQLKRDPPASWDGIYDHESK